MSAENMKITWVGPDRYAYYVNDTADGRFFVWSQLDTQTPFQLRAPRRISANGYATFAEAREALDEYVDFKRQNRGWESWQLYINGVHISDPVDYTRIKSGSLPAPVPQPPAAIVSLANIEYRIAHHIRGAYENLLEVGRCLDEAKEAKLVPHGEWEAWVQRNTGMSERQAQRLMLAARSVRPGSPLERMPISKIQAILALPEPEREAMAERAVASDMSVREIQQEVKRAKGTAPDAQAAPETAKAADADGEAQALIAAMRKALQEAVAQKDHIQSEMEQVKKFASGKVREITALRANLEGAQSYISQLDKNGISTTAKAEIDRLKAELAETERFAEEQAEQRQQAQQEMLALRSETARGEGQQANDELTPFALASAVRMFIGTVGVLPHMGTKLARLTTREREEYRQYIDMVANWISDARTALLPTVIDSGMQVE